MTESPPSFDSGGQRPALTIVFQSWSTPIAGLVMLVFGLLCGYFARPILERQSQPTQAAQVAQVTQAAEATAAPTADPAREAQQAALMSELSPQVRYYLGNADAPVTLIEFGDFQ